jgi:drug/metabolite transporter (DMT)-like permease
MVSTGWLCLAAMIVAYGCANLLQSIAALRTRPHHSMHPSLLLRLAGQRTYLLGVGCQIIGFLLAFLARRELPLFLVQASVSAGIGVMALIGVVALNWHLPKAEVGLLALLGAGVAALVLSAKPGQAHHITATGVMALASALGGIAVLGVFAARLHGAPGSVALGSLAGLAFGAAAIDSRALAAAHSWQAFVFHPLLYLLFAHALLGQLLLGMAMQRGSTTAAVASMDAVSTVPAAVVGLVFLGDQIWPGRHWLAATGFTLTLAAVAGLSRFAQPQEVHAVYEGKHVAGRSMATAPADIPRFPGGVASGLTPAAAHPPAPSQAAAPFVEAAPVLLYHGSRDDTLVLSPATPPAASDDSDAPTLPLPISRSGHPAAEAEPLHHSVHQRPHPPGFRSPVQASGAYGRTLR